MTSGSSEAITQLLKRWNEGDEKALNQLMPLVYDELHRIAQNYLRRERRQQLVHQRGGLQSVLAPLASQVVLRDAVEFVVDQRH